MPIGQFAAASRLSLKALRPLLAAQVDPEKLEGWREKQTPRPRQRTRFRDFCAIGIRASGFRTCASPGCRWYQLDQLRSATLIGLLRRAGMPLVEIRRMLADSSVSRIDEYEATLASELAERRQVLDYVRRFLKEEQMYDVKIKHVEEQPYVSASKRIRVDELERFIVGTVDELTAAHESAGNSFTIYHGEVNEEDDGPVEVCLPVAEADTKLPAGEVAYTVAVGEQTTFPEIIGAYDAVAGWAKANGRELVGPPREIYLEEVTADPPRMEIAWPIR